MSEEKKCNYPLQLKTNHISVIEEKILNCPEGPYITGYLIKTIHGVDWFSKNQFDILFKSRKPLF
jgi:hypothetical protein